MALPTDHDLPESGIEEACGGSYGGLPNAHGQSAVFARHLFRL